MLRPFLLLAGLLSSAVLHAQPAAVDSGFGTGGWAMVDAASVGGGYDILHGLGPMHDGGYLGLASRSVDAVDARAFVVRMADDGTLLGATDTLIPASYVAAVAIAPDGRSLTVASTTFVPPDYRRAVQLSRWRADGTPDTGFGPQGVQTLAQDTYELAATALHLEPDGRTTVAGTLYDFAAAPGSDNNTFIAARLPDGNADPAVGTDGYALVNVFASGDEAVGAILRDADSGRYFACGTITAAGKADAWVARMGSNGFLDPGFGTQGRTRYDSSTPDTDWADRCTALAINPASQRLQALVVRSNGVGQPGTARVFSVGSGGTMLTFVDAIVAPRWIAGPGLLATDTLGRILVAVVSVDAQDERALHVARVTDTLQNDGAFTVPGGRRYPRIDPATLQTLSASSAVALFLDRGRILAGTNFGAFSTETLWGALRLKGSYVFADGFESP